MASFTAHRPAKYDITVQTGRNFSRSFALTQGGVAVSLATVTTIVGQVRDGPGGALLLTLTGAVVSAPGGTFILTATAATTASYTTPKAVWEVVITFDDAVQTTIARGAVAVERGIVA